MFCFVLKPYVFWLNKIHKHTPRTYPRLVVSRMGNILCQPSNKTARQNAVLQRVGETTLKRLRLGRILLRMWHLSQTLDKVELNGLSSKLDIAE